jgi:hypothetical protein
MLDRKKLDLNRTKKENAKRDKSYLNFFRFTAAKNRFLYRNVVFHMTAPSQTLLDDTR